MVAWARVGKQWRRENLMRVWMCSQVERAERVCVCIWRRL